MKCKFFRLIYPKSIEDAQSGSYTVALYAPCEAVLDAQGNKLSSITVVGYYLPIVEQMKVDMTGRWKKDAKYGVNLLCLPEDKMHLLALDHSLTDFPFKKLQVSP